MSDTRQLGVGSRPPHHRGVSDSDPTFWDIEDVQFHCRIGRSTAWRLVREAGFPAPVVLGRRTIVWPRSEVIAFIDEKRDPGHYVVEAQVAREPMFSVRPNRRQAG